MVYSKVVKIDFPRANDSFAVGPKGKKPLLRLFLKTNSQISFLWGGGGFGKRKDN
jgi:hypothetical protein